MRRFPIGLSEIPTPGPLVGHVARLPARGARPAGRDRRQRPSRRGGSARGFTLVELLIVMVVAGIAVASAFGAWRQYRSATVARRAAETVAADLSLARNLAVQRRETVSLVADEASRTYEVHDLNGTVFAEQAFSTSSDLPLTSLDVQTSGDSVAFNSRGLTTITADIDVEVARLGETRVVEVSALGRTKISQP